ncbi:MAG: MBL fold metallo-hydrolase [Sphaerochaeta sp.]|jgi:phosphoribosyl 1,2-cyclic phosphate phosphodiesterase|uniref:MBL fold metallo-hydrolase n=1 Tax=Sphaerochaeta sp. TaxID=1972642 RepID=UPI002FC83574
MKAFEVTFLGTGTSHGIPVIGCTCPVCMSSDVHDKRYRSSILLREGEHTLLVDTTPEFRLQALRSNLTKLDAVLYTHDHADHFNGIDDLRVFCRDRSLDVYCSEEVASAIESRFSYVLGGDDVAGGIPHLNIHTLKAYETVCISSFEVTPIPILHGKKQIFAFRIGSFAYATDCSEVPQQSIPYFQDLDVLVVGALRYWPHPTHYSVFEATAFAKSVGAKDVYFTHLSHGLSHQGLQAELPEGFHVAYDTLTCSIGG